MRQRKPYQPKQRFLVPGSPTGRWEQGYADIPEFAMREEPECLDEDDWNRHVGKPAVARKTAQEMSREKDLKLLSQEERIVKAQAKAAEQRRDVSREMFLLRSMLAKRRSPEKVERKVQELEQVVYLGRKAA